MKKSGLWSRFYFALIIVGLVASMLAAIFAFLLGNDVQDDLQGALIFLALAEIEKMRK